jgi:hypothetical protein
MLCRAHAIPIAPTRFLSRACDSYRAYGALVGVGWAPFLGLTAQATACRRYAALVATTGTAIQPWCDARDPRSMRIRRAPAAKTYSHSMVEGGLDEMS